MKTWTFRIAASVVAGGGLLLAAGGCDTPQGTVTGKVTHGGRPLTSGAVTLVASDSLPHAATIGADGGYSVSGVPNGPVKIGVACPNTDTGGRQAVAARPAAGGGGGMSDLPGGDTPAARPAAAPKVTAPVIAEKYSDPNQSGLSGTVKGDTVIDVDVP